MNPNPRIGIYCGTGMSHSWIWYVNLVDRFRLYNSIFIDESDIKRGILESIDVLLMGGGDTFLIAEALGFKGAKSIDRFVKEGGLYIGSCAGAYLPLSSSKPKLNLFNYVATKIMNIGNRKEINAEKGLTKYGSKFIYHPLRGEIIVDLGTKSIKAPIFGGPSMTKGDGELLGIYSNFTDRTGFLMDKRLAEKSIIGLGAILKKNYGKGKFYLMGPHLEHPDYLQANEVLVNIIYSASKKRYINIKNGTKSKDVNKTKEIIDLKREISNSRIIATGLERKACRWKIGNKIYEAEKIREFLDPIWKRINYINSIDTEILETSKNIKALLKMLAENPENDKIFNNLLFLLKRLTKNFFETYFIEKKYF
jgi:glutamine amidotransferase-like uncharacterized protein